MVRPCGYFFTDFMLKTTTRWLYRIAILALFLAGLAFAGAVLALRYWILPDIGQYREDIASSITRAAGQRVTIGQIGANWEGLRPHLTLGDVRVYDRQGRQALALQDVESTLSWWSLLLAEVRLHSLEINNPALDIRRDAQGRMFIAGIELDRQSTDTGFADWVLQQSRIVIRNAQVEWRDELRQAPPLTLQQVNLRLENSGSRHRLGLRAVPPEDLAGPLDVRADLHGDSVSDLVTWQGRLYARLDRTNLAAWRAWLPFPVELAQGRGGVQAWLQMAEGRVEDVTADVRLNGVVTRLAGDLPELVLHDLRGRLGWQRLPTGFEFRMQHLGLRAANDVNLPPADLLLRLATAQERKPAEGEIRANGLSLEPLVKLADMLPLPAEARRKLAEIAPRGSFRDFSLKWDGEWDAPQRYSVKGGFVGLGVNAYGMLPSISGISGSVDANEKGGSLALDSRAVRAEVPAYFRDPLELDTLTAQMKWKKRGADLDLNLSSASLANRHLAGTLHGSYKTVAGTPGTIDLSGQFSRAEARAVGRYIPLVVGQATRDWLNSALQGGKSADVRLRLKGNLADFPFADGKRGLFEVAGKVTGGLLEYAEGWPKIENVGVDLLFRNARMDITAFHGNTYGMQVGKVRVVIPDLMSWDEMLQVEGDAHGPTADMLRFIDKSPVNAMIDGVSEGMGASGNGHFRLKLTLPLRHSKDTRVAGGYQFVNDRVSLGADQPVLDQVNGLLEFTEASVMVPKITAQALGGPVSISGATQPDGSVRINLQGRVTAAGLRGLVDTPAIRSLSGATDWRGVLTARKKLADLVVESSLAGLGSSLPPPFAKRAGDAVALRYEKKTTGPKQELVQFNYGKILAAVLSRRLDNGKAVIERGTVNLGPAAALPAQPGLWVNADMPSLDLDHWRSALGSSTGKSSPLPAANLNLKAGALDLFGKRLNDVRLSARVQDGLWQGNLQSREIVGTLAWNPEGRGRLRARLSQLTIPEPAPAKLGAPSDETDGKDLPALDVFAENFAVKQKKLGRLELQAVQEDNDWRIQKLRISNPDGSLQMDGLWQGWRQKPVTRANLHIEAQDLGKLLARLGYPDAVKRGTAKLDGQLAWSGSPQDIDYPSLSGSLKLEAKNGQFVKLEPGAGRLLGLLSLQSLPRRLTLDFRDIFSEGFAFDSISGNVNVVRGLARTEDLELEGPAAKVAMQGQTNLVTETQDLKVKVLPTLGDSVSAAAFLGGPVVGIAALVAQKLLKDPIAQIAAYEYSITGTWSDPKVVKIENKPAPSEQP